MAISLKTTNRIDNSKHLLSKLSHIYILTICLGLFIFSVKSPIQNWDILGYAASAVSIDSSNENYIHDYVYSEFKAYSTEKEFKELTENHSYRETMFQDANAFYQQIPFYKIRIILVLLILALVKMGANIFVASHLLAAFFTCSGLLVFYYAFRKLIHPAFWIVVPIFFILFNGQNIARIVTADSLAFLWVGLICYTFLHEKWKTFFLLLISSVLVRTDLIFLIGLFSIYIFIFKPTFRKASIVTILASAGTYLFINNYADNYGWSTVFYYAIVSDMKATHPLEYSSLGISVGQYFSEIKNNIGMFIFNPPALLFEAVVIIQLNLYLLSQKGKNSIKDICIDYISNPVFVLTIISLLYVLIHYILFPLLAYRFFIGQYMTAAMILLTMLSSLIEE